MLLAAPSLQLVPLRDREVRHGVVVDCVGLRIAATHRLDVALDLALKLLVERTSEDEHVVAVHARGDAGANGAVGEIGAKALEVASLIAAGLNRPRGGDG